MTPPISQSRDQLTGLPNRRVFFQWLAHQGPGALLFIDVDYFRLVNDVLGFEVGDQALVELTEHLKELTPRDGYLARCGGDEFILYVQSLDSAHAAALQMSAHVRDRMFADVRRQIADSFSVDELKRRQPMLTVRIGVAAYDGNDPNGALQAASEACDFARSSPERVVVA